MWQFYKPILWRSFLDTPSIVSSNWIAVIISLTAFLFTFFLGVRKEPSYKSASGLQQKMAAVGKHWKQNVQMGALVTVCIWGVLFLSSFVRTMYLEHTPQVSPPSASTKPLTLEDLYKSDFPEKYKFNGTFTVKSTFDSLSIQVPVTEYADFAAGSKSIGFFLTPTDSDHSYDFGETLASGVQKTFDHVESAISLEGQFFGQPIGIKDLTFSGRVFIYHYDLLTPEQIVSLRALYKQKGYAVLFLGLDYLSAVAKRH